MGKKAPSAPAAPDPTVTAQAQSASNIQTAEAQAALNRVNQITPYGNLYYQQQDPSNPQSPWYATQTFSPTEQKLYDLSTQGQQLYGTTALAQLGAAQQSLQTPIAAGVPGGAGAVYNAYNQAAGPLSQQIQLPTSPFAPYQQAAAATAQPFRLQADPYAAVNQARAATAQPFNTNYGDVAHQYIQSQYQLQQPQWDLMRQNAQSQAANQGIAQGSPAYNNLMRQTENQISNAQAQILSGATQNVATAAQTGINLYQAPLAAAQTLGGITGGAEQQALAAYQQPLQTAQGLQGLLAGGATTDIGLQQQAAAAAQAQAGLLGTGLQQATALQQTPLNEASALLSGSQVTQPNFVNAAQTQVQPTNVLGAYGLQQQAYQNQLAGWQAQQQATGAALGGIGSLAGQLGGAAIMASDERIKADIKEVGHIKTPGGKLPIKTFRFRGSPVRHLGFTAQDAEQVDPGAVLTHPLTGLKGVNYSRLLLQAGAPSVNGGSSQASNNGWGNQQAPVPTLPNSGWGVKG